MFLLLMYITQKKLLDKDFEFPLLCDQSIPPNDKVKNLMSTFYDKKNYTISSHVKILFKKRVKAKENTPSDIC